MGVELVSRGSQLGVENLRTGLDARWRWHLYRSSCSSGSAFHVSTFLVQCDNNPDLSPYFRNKSTWDLSSDEFDTWERLLDHGISKALDYGVDAIDFLEELAQTLAKSYDPTYTSATHIAELLMNHLDLYMVDARQVPETLMDFVNDTLRSSYPPDSQTRAQSDWLTNPLGRVIEKCPRELLSKLLETIQDGLCAWFSDECNAMPGDAFDSVRSFLII